MLLTTSAKSKFSESKKTERLAYEGTISFTAAIRAEWSAPATPETRALNSRDIPSPSTTVTADSPSGL
jgi:hypothetical protein